jgi:hypothetical protein
MVWHHAGKHYVGEREIEQAKDVPTVKEESLAKKEEMLKLYESQAKTVDNLSHMNPFEDWTKYED